MCAGTQNAFLWAGVRASPHHEGEPRWSLVLFLASTAVSFDHTLAISDRSQTQLGDRAGTRAARETVGAGCGRSKGFLLLGGQKRDARDNDLAFGRSIC